MRILIIPELEESHSRWQSVVNILEKVGYTVNILDYETPKTDDIEEQTNYAEHFLVDKTVLVGSGVGGRIAIQLLARHHHQISAAVLFSTPSLHRRSLLSRLVGFLGLFLLPIRILLPWKLKKKIADTVTDLIFSDPHNRLYTKVTRSDQETLLPIIKNKVRLVWSKKRPRVHPSIAHSMKELIPDSDLVFVSEGKEPLHVNDPVLVANYIDEYARPY